MKTLWRLPRKLCVAVSGGPDSMAVLDYLKRKHDVTALHFNHKTAGSDNYQRVVQRYCDKNNVPLITSDLKDPDFSRGKEFGWASARYSFFENYDNVVLAHHLDDCVEKYLATVIKGSQGAFYPFQHKNILRPFLCVKKKDMIRWCERNNVPFVIDPTNEDGVSNLRSVIRANMQAFLAVNPGIDTMIKNKMLKKFKNEGLSNAG